MYRNEYPYTNFHDINLDWVLEKTKESLEKSGAAESVALQAKDTATTAKTTAEAAKAESASAAQTAANSATVAQEATNNANNAKIQAFGAKTAADDAQATADANTASITEIQTKLAGIAKRYNIAVGTTWATYREGIFKQEIAVDGLVPGAVNLFELDIQDADLENAVSLNVEYEKIIRHEAQTGKVILYAYEATMFPFNIALSVITNG